MENFDTKNEHMDHFSKAKILKHRTIIFCPLNSDLNDG